MGTVLPYRRRNPLPGLWILLFAAVIGAAGYYGLSHDSTALPRTEQGSTRFSTCGYIARNNCVIDGDTFYFEGVKIRIADIDAPETGGAQCAEEAERGARAARRLRELLNQGRFELHGYSSRDTDRYGRKLRVVVRDGRSIGDTLVAENLARRWTGRRRPWCA